MTSQPANSSMSLAYHRFATSTPGKITKVVAGVAGAYVAGEYAALNVYESAAIMGVGARCGYVGLRNSWRAFKNRYAGAIITTAVVCSAASWVRTTPPYQYFFTPAGLLDTIVEGIGMPVPEMTRIARTVVKKTEYKIYGDKPFGVASTPAASAGSAASAASAPSVPASNAQRAQRRKLAASAPAA